MIIKFNDIEYFLNSTNETCALLKLKVSKLVGKPVEAIRLIHNGYTLGSETIVPSDAIVHCLLQIY